MEILFGILSWDFGDSFGSAFGGWWGATGWLSVIVLLGVVVTYIGLQAYSYVMDQKSPLPFASEEEASCLAIGLGLMVGTWVGSFVLMVALMFWEISVAGLVTYGLLRTMRGVVRLRKALNKHIDDKNAHGREHQ